MKKEDLVAAIATSAGTNKTVAAAALNATVEAITATLKAGEDVRIPGLGTFKVSQRAAKTARNPRTGLPIEIAARRAVGFKAGKDLTASVNS